LLDATLARKGRQALKTAPTLVKKRSHFGTRYHLTPPLQIKKISED
jgi:hypothetical protein